MRELTRLISRWQKAISDPLHLQNFESSVTSQNGEDGIIAEVFKRLGVPTPTFVEFGASDGRENCTRNLVETGASGLWIEGSPTAVQIAREENSGKDVEIVEAFITRANIKDLIRNSRMSKGFDLLVVDVDGNDWWLIQEVLRHWSPRLLIAEYNPSYGPSRHWVMPYKEDHVWGHDSLYGASLKSMEVMLRRFGYRVVACDSRGVNSFWVRSEETHLFTNSPTARTQYVPALPGRAHPRPGLHRVDTAFSTEQLGRISIERAKSRRIDGTNLNLWSAQVRNNSDAVISNFGKFPIRLGLGTEALAEPDRMFLDDEIGIGKVGRALAISPTTQRYDTIAVVQEGVAWGNTRELRA